MRLPCNDVMGAVFDYLTVLYYHNVISMTESFEKATKAEGEKKSGISPLWWFVALALFGTFATSPKDFDVGEINLSSLTPSPTETLISQTSTESHIVYNPETKSQETASVTIPIVELETGSATITENAPETIDPRDKGVLTDEVIKAGLLGSEIAFFSSHQIPMGMEIATIIILENEQSGFDMENGFSVGRVDHGRESNYSDDGSGVCNDGPGLCIAALHLNPNLYQEVQGEHVAELGFVPLNPEIGKVFGLDDDGSYRSYWTRQTDLMHTFRAWVRGNVRIVRVVYPINQNGDTQADIKTIASLIEEKQKQEANGKEYLFVSHAPIEQTVKARQGGQYEGLALRSHISSDSIDMTLLEKPQLVLLSDSAGKFSPPLAPDSNHAHIVNRQLQPIAGDTRAVWMMPHTFEQQYTNTGTEPLVLEVYQLTGPMEHQSANGTRTLGAIEVRTVGEMGSLIAHKNLISDQRLRGKEFIVTGQVTNNAPSGTTLIQGPVIARVIVQPGQTINLKVETTLVPNSSAWLGLGFKAQKIDKN